MERTPPGNKRAAAGSAAEQAAQQWLRGQGLRSVAQNFRCRCGEIDLVMLDREQLVFIEVRLRSRSDYGSAAESVTGRKQQRLIRAAQLFLLANPRWSRAPCRFDVLAASAPGADGAFEWQWLRNAFYAQG
jgi:putative endonuclease